MRSGGPLYYGPPCAVTEVIWISLTQLWGHKLGNKGEEVHEKVTFLVRFVFSNMESWYIDFKL